MGDITSSSLPCKGSLVRVEWSTGLRANYRAACRVKVSLPACHSSSKVPLLIRIVRTCLRSRNAEQPLVAVDERRNLKTTLEFEVGRDWCHGYPHLPRATSVGGAKRRGLPTTELEGRLSGQSSPI